jgi:ketosteroid isomerase-like protein
MSQENVEIVRRAFAAYNRADTALFLELLDPDVEWIPLMASLEGRVYRGLDGIRQWLEEGLLTDWESFETYPEDFRDLGDRVLVSGHWRARGRASGVELERAATWLFDVKGGKIARLQTYSDRAEALEAAGLSEQDAHGDS